MDSKATSFALVTEGVSDHAVIERLIHTTLAKNLENQIYINRFHPKPDETDNAWYGPKGGWERVFEFCSCQNSLNKAMAYNRYLVIQMDTDTGGHQNFGIQLTDSNGEIPEAQIISEVTSLIISKFPDGFYNQYQDQIIFAISIHSIECWILPFYEPTPKKQPQINTCARRLAHLLTKENISSVKRYKEYSIICKKIRRLKDIEDKKSQSLSLTIFIEALQRLIPAASKTASDNADC